MNFGKTVAIEQNLRDVAAATGAEFVSSEELDFIERLKQGDTTAFDVLITRYSGELYALLFRIVENPEEARDLTQETFLRVVQSIRGFRGEASLKTWLFRIAINQARNRQRWWKSRRQNAMVSLDVENSDASSQNLRDTLLDENQRSPEIELLEREQSVQLRQALVELPQLFREAVVLRDIKGLSYEEIAVSLEISVGTVKSRIARGREELRKRLKRSL